MLETLHDNRLFILGFSFSLWPEKYRMLQSGSSYRLVGALTDGRNSEAMKAAIELEIFTAIA
jgi:hypothetical protein